MKFCWLLLLLLLFLLLLLLILLSLLLVPETYISILVKIRSVIAEILLMLSLWWMAGWLWWWRVVVEVMQSYVRLSWVVVGVELSCGWGWVGVLTTSILKPSLNNILAKRLEKLDNKKIMMEKLHIYLEIKYRVSKKKWGYVLHLISRLPERLEWKFFIFFNSPLLANYKNDLNLLPRSVLGPDI